MKQLERWEYKPRGTREKVGAFFAAKNCTASQPQSEVLAEVRRVSEHKSRMIEVVEVGEGGVELDVLQVAKCDYPSCTIAYD